MSLNPIFAPAPFNHAKADIILRSSDKVDFRVFKLFLSLASPFFETLFSIPQPSQASGDQEIKDGLAVVLMVERSKTLRTLLSFCYPCTLVDDPRLEVFEDILDVLEAARKYSLAIIEQKICRTLSNPKILEAEPLRCFAIAHRARLRGETLLAAKYTLTKPLIPAWFAEIHLITAADLLALLTYHQKCGDAVYALKTDLSWVKSHYGSSPWLYGKFPELQGPTFGFGSTSKAPSRDCRCPKTPTGLLRWWETFIEETFEALRERPCEATVKHFAEKTIQTVRALNCLNCPPGISEDMHGFQSKLELVALGDSQMG